MNKIYIFLLLLLFSSCKMDKTVHEEESKPGTESPEQPYDQSEGWDILVTLGNIYGNESQVAGLSLETPDCPDFIEGIYFDKADLVFQVTGDTVKARQVLEKAAGNKNFRIELMKDGNYSQKQLYAINDELRNKLERVKDGKIRKNVTGFGVGLHNIEIDLIVNTPERRKEFREKIMDSPAFLFNGVEKPVINEKIGVSHAHGIYIRPEYPVYSTETNQVTFILNNYSGRTIECGEHYYVTFEDGKGIWRELPMNTAFVDIGYVIQDKGEWTMKASLYPDVHPNKPGRYRYFYEVMISREPVLMMAEFRLTDNEKEWKGAKRTPMPEGLLKLEQDGNPQPADKPKQQLKANTLVLKPVPRNIPVGEEIDADSLSMRTECARYPLSTTEVKIIITNHTIKNDFITGERYSIAYNDKGEWRALPTNPIVNDVAWVFPTPGSTHEQKIKFYTDEVANRPGRYRIYKAFNGGSKVAYAEFELLP